MTRVSRWLLYVGSSALAVQWAPLVASAQITPGGVHSVIRPARSTTSRRAAVATRYASVPGLVHAPRAGDPANPRPYRALSSAIRRRSDRPRPASRASARPIERKPKRCRHGLRGFRRIDADAQRGRRRRHRSAGSDRSASPDGSHSGDAFALAGAGTRREPDDVAGGPESAERAGIAAPRRQPARAVGAPLRPAGRHAAAAESLVRARATAAPDIKF